MDPVGENAVFAAFELSCLFVDDTIAVYNWATVQVTCDVGNSTYWLTPMMAIDTVDRLIVQKYTSEPDNLQIEGESMKEKPTKNKKKWKMF